MSEPAKDFSVVGNKEKNPLLKNDSTLQINNTNTEKRIQEVLSQTKGVSSSKKEKFSMKLLELFIGLESIKESENVKLSEINILFEESSKITGEINKILLNKRERQLDIDKLHQNYKENEKSITLWGQKNETLKKEIQNIKDKDKEIMKNLEEKKQKIHEEQLKKEIEVKEKLVQAKITKEGQELAIKSLQDKIKEVNAKLEEIKTKENEKKVEQKIIMEKIEMTKFEPHKLDNQVIAFNSAISGVNKSIQNSYNESRQLLDEFQTLLVKKKKMEAIVVEKEKQKEAKIDELEHLNSDLSNLDASLELKTSENEKLKEEIKKMEKLKEKKKKILSFEIKNLKVLQKFAEDEEEKIKNIHIQEESIDRQIEECKTKLENLEEEEEKLIREKKEISKKEEENEKNMTEYEQKFIMAQDSNKNISDSLKSQIDVLKSNEKKIAELKIESKNLEDTLLLKKNERDKKFAQISNMKMEFMLLKSNIKIDSFTNSELSKKYKNCLRKMKKIKKQHEKMRMERNKYGKMIHDFSQILQQTSENKKIIENELEILRKKSIEKEKESFSNERKLVEKLSQVEEVKRKQSKMIEKYETTRKKLNEKEIIMNKLNKMIIQDENEIKNLEEEGLKRVDERNLNGLQLMSRNDEVSILNEKKNFQESVLMKGEAELKSIDEMTTAARNEVKDLIRRMEVGSSKLNVINEFKMKKESLEREIESVKRMQENVENGMMKRKKEGENPFDEENKDLNENITGQKYRVVGSVGYGNKVLNDLQSSKDGDCNIDNSADIENVKKSIKSVEEEEEKVKEEIKEKEEMLSEITESVGKLEALANRCKRDGNEMKAQFNSIKSEISQVKSKLKAILAELSIFEANLISIQAQNKQVVNNLEDLKKKDEEISKILDGKNFEDCVTAEDRKKILGLIPQSLLSLWESQNNAKERRDQNFEDYKNKISNEISQSQFATITRTTCPKRPNAYIPDADGDLALLLPHPYLLKPIKPSPPSLNAEKLRNSNQSKILI